MRIGFGFDVHRLGENEELWLGGIKIPHSKGTIGHSDADVLLHAICDAMLGALALGDIGKHFPDTDSAYKNIDSKILLKHVFQLIDSKGYRIGNIDSTLCLELPKILKHSGEMKDIISAICNTEPDAVSIKATTNEKMGFIGREEGVTAYAVVLLLKK